MATDSGHEESGELSRDELLQSLGALLELSRDELLQSLGALLDLSRGQLDLRGTDFTGQDMAGLTPLAPFLQMLRLDDSDTASGLVHLTQLTKLTAVVLSRVPFANQSQFEPLSTLPLLENLFVDGTGLTDEGLALLYSPRLKRLNINDNPGVTDAGILAMTGMQPAGTLLMSGCSVTKTGIEHVRRVLKPKRLEIGGPSIGQDEIDFLLSYNELEALMIGKGTNISAVRQKELVDALTRTRVLFCD